MSDPVQQMLNDSRSGGVIEISFPELYRSFAYALRKCRLDERRFIRAIAEHQGNPYDAAASLGVPKFMADRYLARERVQKAWRALDAIIVHQLGVTTARLISELAALAHSKITNLFGDDGAALPMSEWSEADKAAVESIEVEELFYGQGEDRRQIGVTRKIKMHKKQPALNALLRLKGLDEKMPKPAAAIKNPQPESAPPSAGSIDIDSLTIEQRRVIASIPIRHME